MSQSLAALPRPRSRSRRVVMVVAGAAAVAAAVTAMRRSEPRPDPVGPRPGPEEIVCALPAEPTQPPAPPRVELPGDADDRLAACLRVWRGDDRPGAAGGFLRGRDVTVASVHHWIEVEGDPAWVEAGRWWVPLSGEGLSNFPSGLYGTVALEGPIGADGACGQAIVN